MKVKNILYVRYVVSLQIDSEVFLLSHLRGPSHQEALKKYREQFEASVKFSECSIITDAPADILREKKSREKERQKSLRKRCKKIRQRLCARYRIFIIFFSLSVGKWPFQILRWQYIFFETEARFTRGRKVPNVKPPSREPIHLVRNVCWNRSKKSRNW